MNEIAEIMFFDGDETDFAKPMSTHFKAFSGDERY